MYEKGDLRITDPPCPEGDESCDEWEVGHQHKVRDAHGDRDNRIVLHPCAFLPHSCDEWVIGGPEQIRRMIEDLTEVLKTMEVD